MKKEIWKDVVGFDGLYLISNLGRIRTLSKYNKNGYDTIMIQKCKCEYMYVNLYKNGKLHTSRVHRLVAQAFIENPLNKPQVNHINGIKTDNRVDNLEWATRSENMKHAFRTGLVKNNINSVNAMRKANIKPIYQIKNGTIINEFESVSKASKYLNINENLIYRVLSGFRKTTHHYSFRYK